MELLDLLVHESIWSETHFRFMESLDGEKPYLGQYQVSKAFNQLHKFKCHYKRIIRYADSHPT